MLEWPEYKSGGAIPFPQADDLWLLLVGVGAAAQRPELPPPLLLARYWGQQGSRRLQYFVVAAKWLGLLEQIADGIELAALGKELVAVDSDRLRREFVLRIVAKLPVMSLLTKEEAATDAKVSEEILGHPAIESGVTAKRRLETYRAWEKWLGQADLEK